MTKELKTRIFEEAIKGGLAFIIMGVGLWFFYTENKEYQDRVNRRLEKVEQQALDCTQENISILKDYVQKSNIQLEKNNKAIDKILKRCD